MLIVGGCATLEPPPLREFDRDATLDPRVTLASLDEPARPSIEAARTQAPTAETRSGLSGPRSPDELIRWALAENPMVRAARFNVVALQHRVPQVTALDDPVVSNSIFPIPSVAPQYSLMGYMPYSALLAQQFPWFGTLRLRGEAADHDVKIALFELAAAQLDVVASVKRAYHDLHFSEHALALLGENRKLAEDFLQIARVRYRLATASQSDVLRAEVAVSDIDREMETTRQAVSEARAELARVLHVDPETPIETTAESPLVAVPEKLDHLTELAMAGRPELQGRLAAIARDEKAIELARKRFYPNFTLGAIYQDMERTNAIARDTAMGMPNVGLFVGFNLPIYHKKLTAGVHEAQARAAADAQLYEAERDQTYRDVKDALVAARVQQNVVGLLRRNNLPSARRIFELTRSEYRSNKEGVDYLSLLGAWRDVLQVELQIAQVEAELGKTLAQLERAVGAQLNEHPPAPALLNAPSPVAVEPEADPPARPSTPPSPSASPFQGEEKEKPPVKTIDLDAPAIERNEALR
ncbi:TolC family protein [Paludisphaera borealis]|uniref:Toluene efflux pump outer membrane protein TtgC n=1 Tax=Paludisphaera borealis TaxID=1387353 RepID=A0A1U7CXC9_9BACT|nr:TolC family protein [Paludisphaera borealis]APW63556.1 Toluene efflux pump outer membrane protein TtgC [Paludisphaera borealis]